MDDPTEDETGAATGPARRARDILRQHTDSGWTAMESGVLERALRLFRPSAPVRGRHGAGEFFVASDVVVAQLRQVVDAVPHVAAHQITCATADDDHLESVTIELVAAYGTPLLAAAAQVHTAVLTDLRALLGDLAPETTRIHTHVHVDDVSDDPRTTS